MNSEIACDLSSATGIENDELFVLYESEDRLERIVLYRSIERQLEYILMSPTLVRLCEVHNPTGSNILFMHQYHILLMHKRNIQNYLIDKDHLILFHLFFKATTSEFFDSISIDIS